MRHSLTLIYSLLLILLCATSALAAEKGKTLTRWTGRKAPGPSECEDRLKKGSLGPMTKAFMHQEELYEEYNQKLERSRLAGIDSLMLARSRIVETFLKTKDPDLKIALADLDEKIRRAHDTRFYVVRLSEGRPFMFEGFEVPPMHFVVASETANTRLRYRVIPQSVLLNAK